MDDPRNQKVKDLRNQLKGITYLFPSACRERERERERAWVQTWEKKKKTIRLPRLQCYLFLYRVMLRTHKMT